MRHLPWNLAKQCRLSKHSGLGIILLTVVPPHHDERCEHHARQTAEGLEVQLPLPCNKIAPVLRIAK